VESSAFRVPKVHEAGVLKKDFWNSISSADRVQGLKRLLKKTGIWERSGRKTSLRG